MQTDDADTSRTPVAEVLKQLVVEVTGLLRGGSHSESQLLEARRRLNRLQKQLAILPVEGLADVLVRFAMAYARLEAILSGPRDPEAYDLAESGRALLGSGLQLLADATAETHSEIRPLLKFYALSALRGDWLPVDGWSGDAERGPLGRETREMAEGTGAPERRILTEPAEARRRWRELQAKVRLNADEAKEREYIELTIDLLSRAADGGELPRPVAESVGILLQDQLAGRFLLIFSAKSRDKLRRRKGKEGITHVRDGANAIAAACEFIRLCEEGMIDCDDPIREVKNSYDLGSRNAVYNWKRRAREGKIPPFGAIATAIDRCPNPADRQLATEAALTELEHWGAVYQANRQRAQPNTSYRKRPGRGV
jgi:transposase-like protein